MVILYHINSALAMTEIKKHALQIVRRAMPVTTSDLVRQKGLEPPTYWFVASHSIQLSYQRVYVLHFLCFNTITQIKSKCNTFFIFCKDYLKYIFRVYHRRVLQVQGKGAFCNTLLCVFRQSVNPAPALKCQEVHGI